MAGSYPDAPSRRMAIDVDGTVVLRNTTWGRHVQIEAGLSSLQALNDEAEGYYNIDSDQDAKYVWALFPEPRELEGLFWAYQYRAPEACYVSTNTTTGWDGIWTLAIADVPNYGTVNPNYRNNITSLANAEIRGVRVQTDNGGNCYIRAWHLYGHPSPGFTTNRILYLDAEQGDAQFTKVKDYGDIPRGSSRDFTIKLKNNSSTLTANTVAITAEDLYLGSSAWYTYSSDGVTFSSSLPFASISPGGTQLVYVRQNIPGGGTLGLHVARSKVSVGSWT